MKRILFTILGTIAGIVSLLSFKTSQPHSAAGPLLSAGLQASAPSSSQPAPRAVASAGARTYLGSSVTTRYGVVQVKVTLAGKHLTGVSFAQLTAFDDHSQQINSDAAPQLLKETLAAQSAHIDTVSGASYTSDGYVQSLQSALDAAGIR